MQPRRQTDFFIRAAVEWSKIADALRVICPAGDDPLRAVALGLPRELAWCHLLHAAGRHDAVRDRLRDVLREAGSGDPVPAPDPADMLGRLRLALFARYPAVDACAAA